MGKVLFFDIDGTLYRRDVGIPENAVKGIMRCAEKGHKIVLCTGRNNSMLPGAVAPLPVDAWICGCGTFVKEGDKVLTDAAVTGDVCEYIFKTLQDLKCPFYLENSDHFYYDTNYVPPIFQKAALLMQQSYKDNLRPYSERPARISKITAYPEDRSVLPELITRLEPWLNVIVHEEYAYIEIVTEGYDKGTGVRTVIESLGADIADTIGFGDSNNDLAMLEIVGKAIVMGDAPEELKRRFTPTESLYDDGIAKALARLEAAGEL